MKIKKISAILLATLFVSSCSTVQGNDGDSSRKPYGGLFFGYQNNNVDLVWKLTKEDFFSQYGNAEKEDQFNFTARVIYSHGETASTFLNGKDEVILTFPKDNYSFDNASEFINPALYRYRLNELSNLTTIFEKYDCILMCEYNLTRSIGIENNGTLVINDLMSVPYSFLSNESKGKYCYETYLSFYQKYADEDVKNNKYLFYGREFKTKEVIEDQRELLEEFENSPFDEEKFLKTVSHI